VDCRRPRINLNQFMITVSERIKNQERTCSNSPKLLIATRVFGASGQPWLWRQAVGFTRFQKELLCWRRLNSSTQPVNDFSVQVLGEDLAPYDGARRWLYRLRNLPKLNFYASIGPEQGRISELLRGHRPELILCYFGDIAMRLLPIARRESIPLVAYFHGDFSFLTNRWYRWSLRTTLPQFAAIVVVTRAEYRWMLDHGVPESRLHLIPCGAPTDVFLPCPRKQSGTVRFVMVSRLSQDKGCDLSIKAFAHVNSQIPDTELHIYGDGPTRQSLEHLVNMLGVTQQVRFHGYIEEQRLVELLPCCDVFIQHSLLKEGSPVSIAEAMACGLPVIATPVGGIADQIAHGHTGFQVAEGDVCGMADAMQRLAYDAVLRNQLGLAGRERALKLYDSTILARRLEQVLLSVASA